MQAYIECHNQVAGIVYRNICVRVWVGSPKVKVGDIPKGGGDFQTDKQVMEDPLDIVVLDKLKKKAVVIEVAIPSDNRIEELKEELEKMWGVQAVVPAARRHSSMTCTANSPNLIGNL